MKLILLLFVGFLVLCSQLQHVEASRHYSSPLSSNPPSNEEEQIVHQGNMEKDVTVANKVGGGSFRSGGGDGFSSRGGGFSARGGGGSSSRGSGGTYCCGRGTSGSGLGSAGAAFGLGFIIGLGHPHHDHDDHHHSDGVSSLCINPYFQFWATIIVLTKFILAN